MELERLTDAELERVFLEAAAELGEDQLAALHTVLEGLSPSPSNEESG